MQQCRAHRPLLRLPDQRRSSLDRHGDDDHLPGQTVEEDEFAISRADLWKGRRRCRCSTDYWSLIIKRLIIFDHPAHPLSFEFTRRLIELSLSQSIKSLDYLKTQHSVIHRDVSFLATHSELQNLKFHTNFFFVLSSHSFRPSRLSHRTCSSIGKAKSNCVISV